MNNRKCIVTFKLKNKEELIRIVKKNDGTFEVDSNAKGRGAYVSKDINLFSKIKQQRLLHKVFRLDVDESVYIKLEKALKEKNNVK